VVKLARVEVAIVQRAKLNTDSALDLEIRQANGDGPRGDVIGALARLLRNVANREAAICPAPAVLPIDSKPKRPARRRQRGRVA
jgi:hypothetical protein